jgi:NtrC-family two-component system response regulator AlgB
VSNAGDALEEGARAVFDVIFLDLRLGVTNGLDLIPRFLMLLPDVKIIVVTAYASIDTAVESIRLGAADYLAKPFAPPQVELVTEKIAAARVLERKVQALQERLADADWESILTSESQAMQRVLALARNVAASDATILLTGESGTGKSLLARTLHAWSPRAKKPFMTVSCPAVSPELLEAELFGHVRGAFTGAMRDNPGRVALCDGGTLFLDEIGDLPQALQPKLLRFIQEREYERVGDPRTRHADVRLVAATNRDLSGDVRAGQFREDLYYRLNVIEITLPSLRDRPEDVLPLARHLLAEFGLKYRKPTTIGIAGVVRCAAPARPSWVSKQLFTTGIGITNTLVRACFSRGD